MRSLSITGHWNVSLPSGVSPWNIIFGPGRRSKYYIRSSKGTYKCIKPQENINHFMDMDNINIFDKNVMVLETWIQPGYKNGSCFWKILHVENAKTRNGKQ